MLFIEQCKYISGSFKNSSQTNCGRVEIDLPQLEVSHVTSAVEILWDAAQVINSQCWIEEDPFELVMHLYYCYLPEA